jgi:inositol-phosphate phosphatase/L-galactose 1-phosphate phosphatase/histidinol-phosphatase
MSAGGPSTFLDVAIRLADTAAPIALKYFRTPLDIEAKADASPVTVADREIEAALRSVLRNTVPNHGIFGEEEAPERLDADYVWVIDPIDGTRSFSIGKPLFGTLIGLTYKGEPILGILDNPALKERWIGRKGQPTTFNRKEIRTRACPDIAQAWLSATSPHMFHGDAEAAFDALKTEVRHTVFGCDCNAYGYLANGYLDLVCEADLKPYDFIALVPIVEGAGGVITDWRGRPLGLASDGRAVAAGDKAAHASALTALSKR